MRKLELPGLTGIRFYAALLVYLSHIPVIPGMDVLSEGHLLLDVGVVGVSLFFVLSGFVLTYNYADAFRGGVSASGYWRFVWDRLTKIYPVHLLATAMVFPIAIFSPNLPLDWRAIPFHLLLLQCWWPLSQPTFYNYLNVPSWSISCEWFFYLLAPIAMFFVFGRMRRLGLFVATSYVCGLGLFLWHSPSDLFVCWFAPSRFVEFLVGVFLARVFVNGPVGESRVVSVWAQAAGMTLILAGALYRVHAPLLLHGGLLYTPGSALLILGLVYAPHSCFATHLNRPWIRRLGLASFSFYLIHAPILRAVKGICLWSRWEVRSWAAFVAVSVAMFIVIQAAALAVYYGYEIPAQRRLRSVFRRSAPRVLVTPFKPA